MIEGQTLSSKFYQNGKEVGNFAEGVPLEKKLSINVAAGEYDLGVRVGPPAIMYGSSGVTQWAQKARLVINFTSGECGASANLVSISGGPGPGSSGAISNAAGDIVGR
jgi:hypothetical protein